VIRAALFAACLIVWHAARAEFVAPGTNLVADGIPPIPRALAGRDPAMRAYLESISPLNRAGRIVMPLLVIQGANDPRVPRSEAEQIVRTVRGKGTPVWYLLAMDEGHGFAKKSNVDFAFYARVMFAEQCLSAPQ
jgi:dipeptidyl aminopeptidase/acylaminoacyl peptidase